MQGIRLSGERSCTLVSLSFPLVCLVGILSGGRRYLIRLYHTNPPFYARYLFVWREELYSCFPPPIGPGKVLNFQSYINNFLIQLNHCTYSLTKSCHYYVFDLFVISFKNCIFIFINIILNHL